MKPAALLALAGALIATPAWADTPVIHAGAVVVENVFAWNGVGRLAIEAVFARDYPLIQGFILFFATVVALASVVVDVAYAFLDPRIRYS